MASSTDISLEKIRTVVVDTLRDATEGEVVFGPGSSLDSMGLVSFLADLEFRLAEEFGRELVLASEQAMSRSRSPFRTVTALTEYIHELLTQ